MNSAAVIATSREWGVDCRRGELLARHTTFRVGGRADVFHAPRTIEGLIGAIELCRSLGLRYAVVGGGSNILFSDRGFRGVILSTVAIRGVADASWGLRVSAGESLGHLIAHAEERGARSLNFLAGIPGTIGGAVAMNAGIRDRSIGDLVKSVLVLDPAGAVREIAARDCGFEYRGSAIRRDGLIVLSAALDLDGIPFDREAVLERKRATQPLSLPSAGCVFKNPPGGSAGELIDRSGLKGTTVGKAQISEKHANFIVNLGGATSAEICKLIDIVRQKVYNTFHVGLDLEIEVIDG
jgi:UDP-N-acetylmuramate dehydrogenase